jgi:hypothetical protein
VVQGEVVLDSPTPWPPVGPAAPRAGRAQPWLEGESAPLSSIPSISREDLNNQRVRYEPRLPLVAFRGQWTTKGRQGIVDSIRWDSWADALGASRVGASQYIPWRSRSNRGDRPDLPGATSERDDPAAEKRAGDVRGVVNVHRV